MEAAMMSSQLADSMESSEGEGSGRMIDRPSREGETMMGFEGRDLYYSSEEEEVEDDAERLGPDEEFCIIDDPGLGIAVS